MKKIAAPQEEVKKLYDPTTFFNHGDNPAYKKFMEIMVENNKEGKVQDHRTYVKEKARKLVYARNWDDFLQRDMKCFTFTRAMGAFTIVTMGLTTSWKWATVMLPVGQHGITRISQTQLYHVWGPLGVIGVLALPALTSYFWYKTAKFTGRKFYNHVLLGERNWAYEDFKQNPGYGEYFFKDNALSCEESFPDLARGEMAKKKIPEPESAKKK